MFRRGSPISPLFAEIFMDHFEKNLLTFSTILTNKIKFWSRYVDDIFCIWTGTYRELDQFLSNINKINKNIQFTLEKEENKKLNFLDLTIINKNNFIEYDIYRKPTFTDTIIPKNSNQSLTVKLTAF